MEIWKDIKGYEGYYQVSNLGSIKRLRTIIKTRGGAYLSVYQIYLRNTLNCWKISMRQSAAKPIYRKVQRLSRRGVQPSGWKLSAS